MTSPFRAILGGAIGDLALLVGGLLLPLPWDTSQPVAAFVLRGINWPLYSLVATMFPGSWDASDALAVTVSVCIAIVSGGLYGYLGYLFYNKVQPHPRSR